VLAEHARRGRRALHAQVSWLRARKRDRCATRRHLRRARMGFVAVGDAAPFVAESPLGRRSSFTCDARTFEPQAELPPVDPGHGFALCLAGLLVGRFPLADRRSHGGKRRVDERQRPSGGPERAISLADANAGPRYTGIFLARTRIFQAETRASVAERCIFLTQTRIFQAETRASVAERCIFLAQTRIFRSRAIAAVVDQRVSDARTGSRTSRRSTFRRRSRILPTRSSVSPRRMRISQARRCTGRRARALLPTISNPFPSTAPTLPPTPCRHEHKRRG